jgi:hypothetical protein
LQLLLYANKKRRTDLMKGPPPWQLYLRNASQAQVPVLKERFYVY